MAMLTVLQSNTAADKMAICSSAFHIMIHPELAGGKLNWLQKLVITSKRQNISAVFRVFLILSQGSFVVSAIDDAVPQKSVLR